MTAVAISAEATALDFGDSAVKLSNRNDVNRDKTRYVACLGNHLESGDARQLNSIGGWAGGIWVGHSEVEGAPTMRRTHHMILRGLFTPLETRALMRKADHKELEQHREIYLDGPGVPPFTRGYTAYAGDDLAYVQSDRYRPLGVVEITPLMGVEWNTELRRSLQNFFFPEWEQWQQGRGSIPNLLSDWRDLVKSAQNRAQYQSHEIIAEELLESARLFEIYATNQIEKNRQAIQSMRAADHGGQYVGWHNKCRTFAAQLGITLEDEKQLTTAGNNDGLVAEMRADRKQREEELEMQRKLNAALVEKLTGEKVDFTPAPPPPSLAIPEEKLVEESVSFGAAPSLEVETISEISEDPDAQVELAPIEFEKELTSGCSELNSKGEVCKGKVHPGNTKCAFHGGEKKPVE